MSSGVVRPASPTASRWRALRGIVSAGDSSRWHLSTDNLTTLED